MGISTQHGIGPFLFETTLSTIFGGTDEDITYSNPVKLQIDELSIGFWVKRPTVGGTVSMVARWNATSGSGDQAWVMQTAGTGQFRFACRNKALTFRFPQVDDLAIPANTWVHIGITYTANTLLMYVGGVSVPFTGTVPVDLLIGGASLSIGNQQNGSNYFTGSLDEVAIFNTVLTPTEFLELKNIAEISKHSKKANLVFWDKMGELPNAFPIYKDSSLNPITGTAANMEESDIQTDVHS